MLLTVSLIDVYSIIGQFHEPMLDQKILTQDKPLSTVPSDYATFLQRLSKAVQTSLTFEQYWIDVEPT